MKTGEFYSYEELQKMGWRQIMPFANGILWGKGPKRILWDCKTHKVYEVFENDRYATW